MSPARAAAPLLLALAACAGIPEGHVPVAWHGTEAYARKEASLPLSSRPPATS